MQRELAAVAFMLAMGGACCAHGAPPDRGQPFPSRPIRIVVATTAGGSPDLIARAVSRPAEQYLGQNLIIDNRGGANGIIAATTVANAPPDGYTVLHTAPAVILNPLVHRKLPYDVARDLAPVTAVANGLGYLMLVHPKFPAATVTELVAVARQKPLSYGSSVGSTIHLANELFNLRAGVEIRFVPYKGGSEALNAVAGERSRCCSRRRPRRCRSCSRGGSAPSLSPARSAFPACRTCPSYRNRGFRTRSTSPGTRGSRQRGRRRRS